VGVASSAFVFAALPLWLCLGEKEGEAKKRGKKGKRCGRLPFLFSPGERGYEREEHRLVHIIFPVRCLRERGGRKKKEERVLLALLALSSLGTVRGGE